MDREGLVVHHTNVTLVGKTLESIDSHRTLHHMVFRARRLSNIVLFLRYTTRPLFSLLSEAP